MQAAAAAGCLGGQPCGEHNLLSEHIITPGVNFNIARGVYNYKVT